MSKEDSSRRPIKARSSTWAQKAAGFFIRKHISPNQISVASVFFAGLGSAAIVYYPAPMGLIICAAAIQLRLVCNLLDGMVAIEGGKKSANGALYNEFPDRIADSFLIVALGYASGLPWLGWASALAAALTAYVRVFGGSLGLPQDFRGPMAKQHRMAVMTAACLMNALEQAFLGTVYSLVLASVLIALGSVLTCITRTRAISVLLQKG